MMGERIEVFTPAARDEKLAEARALLDQPFSYHDVARACVRLIAVVTFDSARIAALETHVGLR